MKRYALILLFLVLLFAGQTAAQGGKAEPKPITMSAAKSGTVLAGMLRHGEEMEYTFTGRKDEIAVFANSNTSLFDVRVFDPESGFDTEYDSSRTFDVDLPDTAEYVIFIRRKVGGPRSARFRVSFRVQRP